MAPEDDGVGGGGGDDGGGDGDQRTLPLKTEPMKTEPATVETVSKADFEALGGEIKKLTKASSTKNDKDRVAKGEAEKLLEERNAERDALAAKLESYEKRDADRAGALLHSLPEDVRGRLSPFKDKLQPADWLALLEAEAAAHVDDGAGDGQGGGDDDKDKEKPTPPATGSVRGTGGSNTRELSENAKAILGSLMREGKLHEKLELRGDEKKPLKSKFTRPVKDFFDDMRVKKPVPFTTSEGNKRA
jgi:hypothetical protein